MRFTEISRIWKTYGYEITICLILAFLLIVGIVHKVMGKKGTWSQSYNTELALVKKSHYLPQYAPVERSSVNDSSSDSKGERICRSVLEEIYRKPFNKIRPSFLKNYITEGNNLELDCYNNEYKIAVEYNGIQHYKYVPFFHKTKDSFYNQKYRDDMKRRLCRENGITLIEVPYTVKFEHIRGFLIAELKKRGKIPVRILN